MINDKIKICLEQKEILLTKIFNLTKQLEARSRQPSIHYEDLPQQRQVYIDRLKKCEKLLSSCIAGLPKDEGSHVNKILAGDIPQCECAAEEQECCSCAAHIQSLLGSIVAMDNEILRNTKKERDKQQKRIKRLRKGTCVNKYYE